MLGTNVDGPSEDAEIERTVHVRHRIVSVAAYRSALRLCTIARSESNFHLTINRDKLTGSSDREIRGLTDSDIGQDGLQ